MSHIANVKMEIKDLSVLAEVCEKLGLELVKGQTTYKWYGKFMNDYPLPVGVKVSDLGKCDHVLRVKGNNQAYEVGVRKVGSGYQLIWDFWSRGLGLLDKIGDTGNKIKQGYTIAMIKRQAKARGLTVSEKVQDNGSVKLELVGVLA